VSPYRVKSTRSPLVSIMPQGICDEPGRERQEGRHEREEHVEPQRPADEPAGRVTEDPGPGRLTP
jgi:hypothetical protein